jgi:hypothetical protein
MQAYKMIFLLSVVITVVLFSLDKGPWVFTIPSIIGYIIICSIYTGAIFLTSLALYFAAKFVRKKNRHSNCSDMYKFIEVELDRWWRWFVTKFK